MSLVLSSLARGAAHGQVVEPGGPAPRLIIPGGSLGQTGVPLILIPLTGSLIVPTPPRLIIPKTTILAPQPMVVPAARALTEAEASPAALPSQEGLKRLADSLAEPAKDGEGEQNKQDDPPDRLGAAFDGTKAREYFAGGPLAPSLPAVVSTARSLWSFLLPRFYKPVPASVIYNGRDDPETVHSWTRERGHVIEIAPMSAGSRGEVATAFGLPGETRVQQKIERLMLMAHEFAHVVFDASVRTKENHPPSSAYSAMTEGFAVTMEQLFIDRMTSRPDALGLSPRDAMDLTAIASARGRWLVAVDSHYSEGVAPWRAAYAKGGEEGLLSFLASLSARRLTSTPRSDPAYQLSVGDPELLSAYLGKDASLPDRIGLDAFAKAARGEILDAEESKAASAVIERAGYEGRRRLFERTLLADKRIKEPAAPSRVLGKRYGMSASAKWFEKQEEPLGSVGPAFALAKLSPTGAGELARFLVETVTFSGGSERLFARRGPNERTTAVITGAETLPWDEAGRGAWMQALTRWLIGPAESEALAAKSSRPLVKSHIFRYFIRKDRPGKTG